MPHLVVDAPPVCNYGTVGRVLDIESKIDIEAHHLAVDGPRDFEAIEPLRLTKLWDRSVLVSD
jgi:hypothetical protein